MADPTATILTPPSCLSLQHFKNNQFLQQFNFNNPPQHAVKRHIRVSYDVDNIYAFLDIDNKKGRHKKQATSIRPPPTLPLPSRTKNPPS